MLSPLLAAPLQVVATFSIVEDWVRLIGGEDIELTVMVPAGNDIHLYDPSPGDARRMTGADVVFAIGVGLESWLESFHHTGGSNAEIVYLGEAVPLLDLSGTRTRHHEHGPHCDHGDMDPHVWLDPQRVQIMVGEIEQALTRLAPDKEEIFATRAAAYREELDQLDVWIREQVDVIPAGRRLLITYHDNLRYFAGRYGFEIKGNVLSSFTTEASDPSARQFISLIRTVREHRIPGIFIDAYTNPRLAQQLVRETDLPPPSKLYPDSLGIQGSPPVSYLDLMKQNVMVIVRTLAPAPL